MAERSGANDPAEAKSPVTPHPLSDDPARRDPPSFPAQDWGGKHVKAVVGDVWQPRNETGHRSRELRDWENDPARPSAEQIIDALQNIFHQMGPSIDGAATSLNAILQGPYFDDDALMQLTGGGPMDAYTINMALRSFNLSLQPASSQRGVLEPHLENAFLVYQFKRWFPLRRVGAHWLNLSERVIRPVQILPWHLSLCLGQLQDDGCEVYVIRGKLPMCAADESKFFDEHFHWCLNGGIMAEDMESECCEGVCSGECTCYEFGEDSYEDELQAAIEASLADVQPGKPLQIKTSPPSSLISSEEQVSNSLALKGVTSKSQERDRDES